MTQQSYTEICATALGYFYDHDGLYFGNMKTIKSYYWTHNNRARVRHRATSPKIKNASSTPQTVSASGFKKKSKAHISIKQFLLSGRGIKNAIIIDIESSHNPIEHSRQNPIKE